MSAFKKFLLSAILTFTVGITYAQITNVKPPPAVDYAEDAAHSSGARGTFILGVRNDAGAVLAGTDGDYIPLATDASGNLRITAIAEVATVADGGALPALTKVVSGYDGANVQVIKTDTVGELQIDVLTSALPTGAATAANQSTEITSLANIDAGTPAALGQGLMVASMPVTIASDQSAIPASQSGVWNITNVSGTVSLPTGAATAANQSTEITSLSSIDGGTPAALGQTTMAASMPVTMASNQSALPVSQSGVWNITDVTGTVSLPTGAATAANQTTGNTSLSSIDGGTPAALGQTTMLSSMPVTIASDQSAVPASQSGVWNITNVSGTVSLPTGAATAANQTTGNTSLSSIDGGVPAALGQTLMASSMPITIASDQSALPASQSGVWNITNVSGTVSLPTGAATAANQTTGNTSLANIDTGTPAALGQTTMLSSMPVTLASDQSALAVSQSGVWNITNVSGTVSLPTGAATSANQTTGNTSLANIDTGTPAALGQTTMAASMPVTFASDQSALPTKAPVNATGSGSAASATVSTVITLTAPANTAGFVLMNLDTSTANLRWAIGRTATTVLGQQLQAGRDTGFIPSGANISLVAESGTQNYDVQWISQ